MEMGSGGKDGTLLPINMTILVCLWWTKRSIKNMKLKMHKLDTALWFSYALALVHWDHPLSAIFWVLAILELHEVLRHVQGMDPLDDSELAQFRVNCYRSTPAWVAAAMDTAAVMRLPGTPSMPTVPCTQPS
jgi:hypothetical protein